MADRGNLKIQCFKGDNYIPLDKCKVTVKPNVANRVDKKFRNTILETDTSGLTNTIELDTTSIKNSLEPTGKMPYKLYDLFIEREGFNPVSINGVQIYPNQIAYQKVNLNEKKGASEKTETINITPNVLFGDFPSKIPEPVDKILPPPSSGVVLPEPIIPEFITVHLGGPESFAENKKVLYKDYIKNVASSEIYSTWPDATIKANIFCITSFTLNRIYTEWYRSKGKLFDITNSTAYDHAFVYGRNIYENISNAVDEVFSTYVKRIGKKQPLLTQYCNGTSVKCPGWLAQWGSKDLGDNGKDPFEILKYFYGNNIQLSTAKKVQGNPKSYPGYTLTVGSRGEPVKTCQEFLNRISNNYPLIPKVSADGIYGPKTKNQVMVFQGIFGLPKTGQVDYKTWYKISEIYVGVTRIAELN